MLQKRSKKSSTRVDNLEHVRAKEIVNRRSSESERIRRKRERVSEKIDDKVVCISLAGLKHESNYQKHITAQQDIILCTIFIYTCCITRDEVIYPPHIHLRTHPRSTACAMSNVGLVVDDNK